MLDGPRCHGRQKGFGTLYTLESSLKIVDVGLEGSLAYEREEPVQITSLPPGCLCQQSILGTPGRRGHRSAPADSWFARAFFVAAEALAGIVRKVRLAELTVVDAVKTDGNLLLYDFSDRAA